MNAPSPSHWLDPSPAPGPVLAADLDCDVAIIGAGYTGLNAALELRRRGASVVICEAEYAGFGASGRNAGHLTPTIGKDLPTILRLYGRERGGALVRLAERAVAHVEAQLDGLAIDADYVPAGNVVAGMHPGQAKRLQRAAAAGKELGADLEWLEPRALEARGLPRFVSCGYLERRGGVLDPGSLVRGLRNAALDAGAQIFEKTPVTALEHGAPVTVRTPHGSVRAGAVLFATNAYGGAISPKASRWAALRVPMVATVPLSGDQRAAIGWPGGEGIYTSHEILESFRLTADGRIAAGSRFVAYPFRGRPRESDAPSAKRLEALLQTRFPEAPGIEVARHWGGQIATTLHFLPLLGSDPSHPNVHHSLAYAGHGVALAALLGSLAGGLAAGEDPGISELTGRRTPWLPPEPARWLIARSIIAGLGLADRQTDRRSRPRSGV